MDTFKGTPRRFITSRGYMANFKKSCVADNIFIEDVYHRPSFFEDVEFSLNKISQANSGQHLFRIIQLHSQLKKILITYTNGESQTSVLLTGLQRDKLKPKTPEEEKLLAISLAVKTGPFKNSGTDADISFNPDISIYFDQQCRPTISPNGDKSWLILAHELIHAMRMLKGTSTAYLGDINDPKSGAAREELRAIGLGKKKYPSENSIRIELGEFLRNG